MQDRLPEGGFGRVVPELDVRDLDTSLGFWCGGLGFTVAYARPESAFAYLEREGAQVMLNTRNGHWETGALALPFGRGINLQIRVDALADIVLRLETLAWPLFRPPHDAWYRVGADEVGCRQLLVQDPDGYLLRLSEDLGMRPLSPGARAS